MINYKIVNKKIKIYDAIEGVHEDLYQGFFGIKNEQTGEMFLDYSYAFIDQFYLANFDNDQFTEGDALFKIYETDSEWYNDIAQFGYLKNKELVISKNKYSNLKFFYNNYALTTVEGKNVIIDMDENIISEKENKELMKKLIELDKTFDLIFNWEYAVDNKIIDELEKKKKKIKKNSNS